VWRYVGAPQGKDLEEYKALPRAETWSAADEDDLYVATRRRLGRPPADLLPAGCVRFAPFFFPDGQARDIFLASNYLAPRGPRVRSVRDQHRRAAHLERIT